MTSKGIAWHWLPRDLKEERDNKIIAMANNGISRRNIAEIMGMSHGNVNYIIRNRK